METLASYAIAVGQLCFEALLFGVIEEENAYFEAAAEEFAEVLRLDPQDILMDLPLLITAGNSQVGEETIRKEAVLRSVITGQSLYNGRNMR